jgi:hypothetical protein
MEYDCTTSIFPSASSSWQRHIPQVKYPQRLRGGFGLSFPELLALIETSTHSAFEDTSAIVK